jgi:curved DNA-binding protein CbpA
MTLDPSDPYAVLGVTPPATQEQIRRAYRTMTRLTHPDTRGPGPSAHDESSTSTFQQVIGAYAILGDPVRRAEYDRRHSAEPRPRTVTTRRTRPTGTWARTTTDQPPIQASPVRWHQGPT